MAETFYSLYEEAGVFDCYGQPGWEEEVPLLSSHVTFTKAYVRMTYYKKQMDDGTSSKGRGGNDTKVLTGSDTAGTGNSQMGLSGQSEFEQRLDQAAGYGLFIFAITQKITDMPKSIIANAGLVFAGKVKTEDDVNVIVKTIAKDPKYDDRDVAKWFPCSPTGWFVCQSSRTTSFMDAEPVLVKVSMLNVTKPTNEEIDEILAECEAVLALRNSQVNSI